MRGIVEVEPQTLKEWMDTGQVTVIDVREPAEYMMERLRGALLCPLSTLDPKALPDVQNKKLVLHCGSGKRSGMAAQRCIDAGFESMTHLKGGMTAWKDAKLPYKGIDPTSGSLVDK